MTDIDRSHGTRIYTPSEAASLVRGEFDSFRDYVRAMAKGSFGKDDVREALVNVVERFNQLDDGVLARFGQASPRGPERPELADDPPGEYPVVQPIASTSRNAHSSAFHWTPPADQPTGQHRGAS